MTPPKRPKVSPARSVLLSARAGDHPLWDQMVTEYGDPLRPGWTPKRKS